MGGVVVGDAALVDRERSRDVVAGKAERVVVLREKQIRPGAACRHSLAAGVLVVALRALAARLLREALDPVERVAVLCISIDAAGRDGLSRERNGGKKYPHPRPPFAFRLPPSVPVHLLWHCWQVEVSVAPSEKKSAARLAEPCALWQERQNTWSSSEGTTSSLGFWTGTRFVIGPLNHRVKSACRLGAIVKSWGWRNHGLPVPSWLEVRP